VRRDLGLPGRLDHLARFVHAIRDGLVHRHMLALLHRGNRNRRVQVIGRHDFHGVQVLLLLQQFAEVGVSGAAFVIVRGALGGVISLDDFAADFASSGNPVDPFMPIGLAEELPNVVPQSELVPVHVVVAAAVGVARGDNLNIVVLQHRQQLADALRAHANVSDGQFVARATKLVPPRTWRGTMVKAAAVVAAVVRNVRRF